MNIQQKVSKLAQQSKENKTKGVVLTEAEQKKQDFEEITRDNLSDHEHDLIKRYQEKLAPLGSFKQEYEVFDFLKKYDWNEKIIEGIAESLLKKKEQAGDLEGWTQVKKVEKVPQKPPQGQYEQKGDRDRKNKRYQKQDRTGEQGGNNEAQGQGQGQEARQHENETEEQRSFRKGPNQNRRRDNREDYHQGEYQEGYYKERYYNQNRSKKHYDKNRSPGGYVKKSYEPKIVEYVKKEASTSQGPIEEQIQAQERAVTTGQNGPQEHSRIQEQSTTTQIEQPRVKNTEHKEEVKEANIEQPKSVHESAKKSQKEQEVTYQRAPAQQTPTKGARTRDTAVEHKQSLKTPEKPHETVTPQEVTQGSGIKTSETREVPQQQTTTNAPIVNPTQGGLPQQQQPVFNPYMMPMVMPTVKEMQPIFPFPYIVFPQPNGTCLIQPLFQMMPPMMQFPQTGVVGGEQGKIPQPQNLPGPQILGNIPQQGGNQKQSVYNPFENLQPGPNPFFNFANDENKKGQNIPQQQPLPGPFVLPNMGGYFPGQQQQQVRPNENTNINQQYFQK